MDPGKLDQRIRLERKVRRPDGGGGQRTTWEEIATVWAAAKPRGGREGMTEGRVNAAYPIAFTIRNRADLDETNRIFWLGAPYNITGILRAGPRAAYLTIDATRGEPA